LTWTGFGGAALLLEQFDVRVVAWSRAETCVACDERHGECLGQRYKSGVVGGEVVAQFPDAVAQRLVGIAHEGELGEVASRVGRAIVADLFGDRQSAERVKNLGVDQMRGVQVAVSCQALDEAWSRLAGDEGREYGRGIDHEHRRLGVAVAAGANGGDDRAAACTTGARAGPRQQLDDWGVPGDALELGQREVGERYAGGRSARTERAVDVVWDVADLNGLHD